MKPDDKLPDDTIYTYDPAVVIAHEEQRCICGSTVSFRDCVKCKAKDMSARASLVVITNNEYGVTTDVREAWVH